VTVYRLSGLDALCWRHFDDETVVFDDRSGDTHGLDPLAAQIFEYLLERPVTLDEIHRRICAAEGAMSGEYDTVIASALEELRKIGLLAPSSA
jgi:PqqD family protein of HPr-rel-A system